MDPLTMALILGAVGATAGGFTNERDPLKGALMGGLLGAGAGYGGASFFAPTAASGTTAAAGAGITGLPSYLLNPATTGAAETALSSGVAPIAGQATGYGLRQGINDFMLANSIGNPRTGMLSSLLSEPPQQYMPTRQMMQPYLVPKKRIIGA